MKISTEVLAVLSGCRCEGAAVFLPEGQLDRKLYVSVNKVLEALGGKWNRKAKAHLFEADPATRLDDAIVTGEIDKPADFGFFETPAKLADRLVALAELRKDHDVLEPSAGRGRIVDAIKRAFPLPLIGTPKITVVELQEQHRLHLRDKYGEGVRLATCVDFLDYVSHHDRIVANSPFAKGADVLHVTHMYSLLRPGGRLVAIMSAGVEFRQDKRTVAFRALVEANGGTIERLPEGSFKESGTMVNTVVVTMEKQS